MDNINNMAGLIGRKITGLRINGDQTVLVFDTDKGTVAYVAYLLSQSYLHLLRQRGLGLLPSCGRLRYD